MGTWPAVVGPAVVLALTIRTDARLIGPYFALSELVPGYEGLDAKHWYEDQLMRFAVFRRFMYPLLAGLVLTEFDYPFGDVIAVAAMAAGLLLWPVLFHGLPRGVSRRDWEVPAIYTLFLTGFIGAAAGGHHIHNFMRMAGGGSIFEFLRQTGVEALVWLLIGASGHALMRPIFESARRKLIRREEAAAAMQYEGNPADIEHGKLDDSAK